MTSSTAKDTYQKHGASDECNDEGTGGPSANEVYEIVGKEVQTVFVFKYISLLGGEMFVQLLGSDCVPSLVLKHKTHLRYE